VMRQRFELGQLLATPGALEVLVGSLLNVAGRASMVAEV
jgi:hypothetical protein